ncbi:hypothetical protein D3C87_1832480 [compost metagenome]
MVLHPALALGHGVLEAFFVGAGSRHDDADVVGVAIQVSVVVAQRAPRGPLQQVKVVLLGDLRGGIEIVEAQRHQGAAQDLQVQGGGFGRHWGEAETVVLAVGVEQARGAAAGVAVNR